MLEYFRMVTSGVLPESYSSQAKLNESPESSDEDEVAGVVFRRNKNRRQNKRSDRLKKGNLSQERRLAIEKEKSKKPNKVKTKPEEIKTISKTVIAKPERPNPPMMEVLNPQTNWIQNYSSQGGFFKRYSACNSFTFL